MKRILMNGCLPLLLAMSGGAIAQAYPGKVIRLFTAPAGSSSDFISRVIVAELTTTLGQTIVVENRPGGIPLFSAFMKNAPDGYSILVTGGALWTNPLMDEAPYDPIRDFAPVTTLTTTPNILIVNLSMPSNVAELVKAAKAKPGGLNYSSGATGSSSHIAGELFKSQAGVDIVRIGYNNQGQNITDLISGRIQMTFGLGAQWGPQIKSGKVRALGTTGTRRSQLTPDLPAVIEAVPGFFSEQIQAMFVPAKTPDAIIRRLNQETNRALDKSQVKDALLNKAGLEPNGSTPQELLDYEKAEMARVSKLIKDLGAKFTGQ